MSKIASVALLVLFFSACAHQGMKDDDMMMKKDMHNKMDSMSMDSMKKDEMKKDSMKNNNMDKAAM